LKGFVHVPSAVDYLARILESGFANEEEKESVSGM
jgi:hypothetical protein